MRKTAIISACTALAAAFAATEYEIYRKAFYSKPGHDDPYVLPRGEQYQLERERMLSLIRDIDSVPYEPVYITSYDGTRLFGRYYHVRDGAPLQIELHGYRGSALRDFCGGDALARSLGMNTLLVDERGHGKSGGHAITFGVRERYDCLAWCEWAAARFGAEVPIFLAGVSMGAATVLMAAELPLPANVRGIFADCPYSSPAAIIRKVVHEDMRLPAAPAMALVRIASRVFAHFGLNESSAVEAVRHAKVPILLVHGEDDRFVPCYMSREIYENCASPATLETFPGAGHGLSYIVDEPRYRECARKFVAECLAIDGTLQLC